jgi:hypothetical protein
MRVNMNKEALALEWLNEMDTHTNCAYCEAGIIEEHTEEACIPPVQGVDLEALDRLTQFIKEAE